MRVFTFSGIQGSFSDINRGEALLYKMNTGALTPALCEFIQGQLSNRYRS